jgi:hypothetical protein
MIEGRSSLSRNPRCEREYGGIHRWAAFSIDRVSTESGEAHTPPLIALIHFDSLGFSLIEFDNCNVLPTEKTSGEQSFLGSDFTGVH